MRELQTMTFPLLVLCLLCFVLRLNNAALLCGGRGYKNEFGICVCGSNYHGVNCEFCKNRAVIKAFFTCTWNLIVDYCPFGPSWFGLPVKSEARNISVAPCSDMVNSVIFVSCNWFIWNSRAFAIFTLVSVSVVPVMRGVHVNEVRMISTVFFFVLRIVSLS